MAVAGPGTDQAQATCSGAGETVKQVLPQTDVKESPARTVESCLSGKSSSIGGKASSVRLPPVFAMGSGGPDKVSGGLTGVVGSGLPFAFGPGHNVNRLPEKFMGMGAGVHGGHFFYDNVQQRVVPMLAAPKPSGAAAAAAAARKRRKELTRSRNIFNRHLARTTSAEVVVPAAVS